MWGCFRRRKLRSFRVSKRWRAFHMSVEQFERRSYSGASTRSGPHTFASYERALSEQRKSLREALAREEALRHELDKLTRQHKVVTGLFGPRQAAADRIASLTPRQRQ